MAQFHVACRLGQPGWQFGAAASGGTDVELVGNIDFRRCAVAMQFGARLAGQHGLAHPTSTVGQPNFRDLPMESRTWA